jgi:type IV pilus assembly protein PilV
MPIRQTGVKAQRGVALIEVLIAFLILSVGLVGFSALQVRAVKATQSSLQRNDAAMLATFILESMRANKAAAIDLALPYNLTTRTCTAPDASTSLAETDLVAWFSALKTALGNVASTCADITCTDVNNTAPGVCTVNVYWDDSRALGGSATQTVQMVSRL